jgi:hypothetical protein
LGCHRKPSRIRLLPAAAVPALAATAAAVCLAPQARAGTAPAHAAAAKPAAAAQPAAALGAAVFAGLSPERLIPAAFRGTAPGSARPASYTVRPGDSLSSIARHFYHRQSAWPVLYWANRDQVHWANILSAGQVLKVPAEPATIPAAPGQLGPAAAAPAAAVPAAAAAPATAVAGSYSGGSFAQCVIARESGGNAQVMNASGHYGLYQFSESTWVAYGGSAADFGHASVAEQNQVFATAMAQGGQSNWAPYDGC